MLTDNSNIGDDVKIYEVQFKGGRREYFICPESIEIRKGQHIIVQADRGEHLGQVNRIGDRSMFPLVKEVKSILRLASYTDLQIMVDNQHKEKDAFFVCRDKIAAHGLKMKLVDVEYQFDGNKICFFFTADKRIDFRALVKDLAAEYRTRIELRQIGVRDEARRIGGMGVCGRSLCCATWLSQFEPITSQMARDQNLSLSPSKISGLCGRLMCCLAYEEDFYKNQLDVFPDVGIEVGRDGINYYVTKVDIFNDSFTIKDGEGEETTLGIAEYKKFKLISTHKRPPSNCVECENTKEAYEGLEG